jgi:hypothetical protein
VPYSYKDLKANPYYYPPQPPLGCISYDDVRNWTMDREGMGSLNVLTL